MQLYIKQQLCAVVCLVKWIKSILNTASSSWLFWTTDFAGICGRCELFCGRYKDGTKMPFHFITLWCGSMMHMRFLHARGMILAQYQLSRSIMYFTHTGYGPGARGIGKSSGGQSSAGRTGGTCSGTGQTTDQQYQFHQVHCSSLNNNKKTLRES